MSGDIGLVSLEVLQRHERIAVMRRDLAQRELEQAERRWQYASREAAIATNERNQEEHLERIQQQQRFVSSESLILSRRIVAAATDNQNRAVAQARVAGCDKRVLAERFKSQYTAAEQVGYKARAVVGACRKALERQDADNLALNRKSYEDVTQTQAYEGVGPQSEIDSCQATTDLDETFLLNNGLNEAPHHRGDVSPESVIASNGLRSGEDNPCGDEASRRMAGLGRRLIDLGGGREAEESPAMELPTGLHRLVNSLPEKTLLCSSEDHDSRYLSTGSTSSVRGAISELPTSKDLGAAITTAIKVSRSRPEEVLLITISKETNQSVAVNFLPRSEQTRKLARAVVQRLSPRLGHGRCSVQELKHNNRYA